MDEVIAQGFAEVRAVIERCALDMHQFDVRHVPIRLVQQLESRGHAVFTFVNATYDDPPGSGDFVGDHACLLFEEIERRMTELIRPVVPAAFIWVTGVTNPQTDGVTTYLPGTITNSVEVSSIRNKLAKRLVQKHRSQLRRAERADPHDPRRFRVRERVPGPPLVGEYCEAFAELEPLWMTEVHTS